MSPRSGAMLGSSRAARRRSLRRERARAASKAARRASFVVRTMVGSVLDLVLLLGLPIVYLGAFYVLLDRPARWIWRQAPVDLRSGLEVGVAAAIAFIAIARAAQGARPVAPVRPAFARGMLVAACGAALWMTIGDLAAR